MAYFANTAHGTYAGETSFFGSLFAAVQRYRLMRRTYNELSNLSDRELDDLGLARADLAQVARSAAGYV